MLEIQELTAAPDTVAHEYATLMERCGAGVLILDAEGKIERSNFSARQLLRLPLFSAAAESLSTSGLLEELRALLAEAQTTVGPVEREVRAPGPLGGSLVLSVSPVIGEETAPPRFLVVIRDVSELRRLEKVRRDFVANVSHELRTPLASIRAMAETLQDGALSDEVVAGQFLGTIVTEVQRLTRISEDLLVLSDAESRSPEKAPFNLSELIEKALGRFRPQAEKAGIVLEGSVPAGLLVEANHDQIEQVLVNLVDNSIKYTAAGGRVHVSAERFPDHLGVNVVDTGIGIQAKDLPRIFERFYRVDKARSRQSGGTGLGLSIVKHIVESHGGQVTVNSEYNQGSTFTFTLPGPPH